MFLFVPYNYMIHFMSVSQSLCLKSHERQSPQGSKKFALIHKMEKIRVFPFFLGRAYEIDLLIFEKMAMLTFFVLLFFHFHMRQHTECT